MNPTGASVASPRPKLLVLAYACEPERGSEPGAGWNRVVEIAKHCDTWVLCEQHEFADKIRQYQERHGCIPGLTFLFVPKHAWERVLERVPGMYYFFYNQWHRRAFCRARREHARVHFDLVHQLNHCGYREPGYLWKLGVPFVWGPLGGTQNFPWRFLAEAGWRGAIHETLRGLINKLQLRFSPRVRQAARRAAVLVAANSLNRRDFAAIHHRDSTLIADVGATRSVPAPRSRREGDRPLRILWSGSLLPFKGLSLLIKALAILPSDVAWELRVLGRGPSLAAWQRLARRSGVAGRITWSGWLPHTEALRQFTWADVFAFTSLRDTTGTVVVEALGAALPIVCLDHQGVGDVVDDRCGIKIPVTSPREVVRGLCEATIRLARDPDLCARLSRGAYERAEDYLWSRQGEALVAVYRQALEGPAALLPGLSPAECVSSTGSCQSDPVSGTTGAGGPG